MTTVNNSTLRVGHSPILNSTRSHVTSSQGTTRGDTTPTRKNS